MSRRTNPVRGVVKAENKVRKNKNTEEILQAYMAGNIQK